MQWLMIAILLFVVIVFGVSSTSQSYATAQQAKAQIEVAQVAQINAWGNLVTILTVAMVFIVIMLFLAAALWLIYRRSTLQARRAARADRPVVEARPERQLTINELIQLETLRTLREMRGSPTPALPEPASDDDVPTWLQ